MATRKVLTVGLSGASCSGKTTLANMIRKAFNRCEVLNQDSYYYLEESPHHLRDPVTKQINWEVLQAFDMDKMVSDLQGVISRHELQSFIPTLEQKMENNQDPSLVVVVEGISVLNDPRVRELCDLQFFLTLDKSTMSERRQARVWDENGDCWTEDEGYFNEVAWPGYQAIFEELEDNDNGVDFLDSRMVSLEDNYNRVLAKVVKAMELSEGGGKDDFYQQ